jgi:hypothetical protein
MNELNTYLQGSESLRKYNTWQSNGVWEDISTEGNASVIKKIEHFSEFWKIKKKSQ